MGNVSHEAGEQGLAPGTLIDGRYRVVRFIGEGGNGHVHEVEHILTGRRLALKSLVDASGYARLEQEARATSLMKNAHAVKVTDMGVSGPAGPYLVMELLEGQSLRHWIDDAGQLPLELAIDVALQVSECLAEAHTHGIIHRDLKPENVFLCAGPAGQHEIKVLDFGVVKIDTGGQIPNSSLTRTGSTVGTPYYMSLEQLRNSSNVDVRTDIYALGVVIYECLTGRKPYQADTIGELVYAICSGPPTHVARLRPDLPADVADVVMRALASNREERPATMIEFATALAPHGDPRASLWLKPQPATSVRPPRASVRAPAAVRARGDAAEPPAPRSGPGDEPLAASVGASATSSTKTSKAEVAPTAAATPARGPVPAARSSTGGKAAVPIPAQPLPASAEEPGPRAAAGPVAPLLRTPPAAPQPHEPPAKAPAAAAAASRPAPPVPLVAEESTDGGRDTPTEMYVKAVHRVPVPAPRAFSPEDEASSTGDPPPSGDTPTRALSSPFRIPSVGARAARPTPPPIVYDEHDESSVATQIIPSSPRSEEPIMRDSHPLLRGAVETPLPSLPAIHAAPLPEPSPPAPPAGTATSSTGTLLGAPPPPPALLGKALAARSKPKWQLAFDSALVNVGGGIERSVGRLARWFWAQPPRRQQLLTAIAASVAAGALVLLIYLAALRR